MSHSSTLFRETTHVCILQHERLCQKDSAESKKSCFFSSDFWSATLRSPRVHSNFSEYSLIWSATLRNPRVHSNFLEYTLIWCTTLRNPRVHSNFSEYTLIFRDLPLVIPEYTLIFSEYTQICSEYTQIDILGLWEIHRVLAQTLVLRHPPLFPRDQATYQLSLELR